MSDDSLESHEITFETGLPGFPEAKHFVLVSWEDGPFSTMRCLEDTELEFVVVPPIVFYPDYEPEIDDSTASRIGLESADDALVLCIVSVSEEIAESTINLLGPVVINYRTRQGVQAVLQNTDYDVRAPLVQTADA